MTVNFEPAMNGKSRRRISSTPPPGAPSLPPPPPLVAAHRVNILMVDDTPENLIALEAVLSDLGQNIIKAGSGEEALRLLLKHDFAVILLDVNMPGMNGFDTASLIRQRKNSEHTPIIFVTAISTTETHMYKGYSLGAVDYIFTPVMPDVLRTKVGVFVELLKKTEEMRQQSEQIRLIEEKEHQRKLVEATERLELQTKRNRFFTLSIDMLAIAGFDGFFKQLNPTWQKVLGFSEEELYRTHLPELVHKDDREAFQKKLLAIRSANAPAYFESRCTCRDEGYRWLDWTVAPFQEEELLYLFARDVTERKRAEQEIKQLNEDLHQRALLLQTANSELQGEILTRQRAEEALQESNAALEAFSYSVSHDLRAPLRAMQGFGKVLLEDYNAVLDEPGREYAMRIVSASTRMDQLIQDLLVFGRLGHTKLETSPLNLDDVLTEVLESIADELREQGARLVVDRPLPMVLANKVTLVQVLVNLISNGCKFVTAGTAPKVRIRAEPQGDRIRLWIEDNGIGIPTEHHARIFGVFERLHGGDDYPGTGIGLAIVKKGIERMGGEVGLESESGQGSRFWIQLPRAS
jgi:PAS domain S-box-containing protein